MWRNVGDGMRVLVIGGTRFVGPLVVRQLADAGEDVAVFHRGETEGALPIGVRHIHGDRRRLNDYAGEVRGFAPEVVVDMIPLTEGDARGVVDAFRGIAGRVVACSSGDVYRAYGVLQGIEPGPPDPAPLTEDSPLRSRLYPYRGDTPRAEGDPKRRLDDYDKIPVERTYLGEPSLPGTVLRLPYVYGPLDYQHRLYPYVKRMDDDRPAIIVQEDMARFRWTRGYVEDVARAVVLAVRDESAAGRVYNVGDPEPVSEADWVREVGRVVGWRGEVLAVSKGLLPPELRDDSDYGQDLAYDTGRIRRELGYSESVPRDEALTRTVPWERANPPQDPEAREPDYAIEDAVLARI